MARVLETWRRFNDWADERYGGPFGGPKLGLEETIAGLVGRGYVVQARTEKSAQLIKGAIRKKAIYIYEDEEGELHITSNKRFEVFAGGGVGF